VSETAPTTDLADRYGTAPSRWRPLGLGIVGLLVVAFLAWVAWAAIEHGSPDVDADLIRFDILSDHEVEVGVDVILRDGVRADCRLRAIAEDKHTVGDLAFAPTAGRNTVTMRTERLATSVELLGCTTRD
jgi:hypothetical protein